ncbi:MAG: ABC transporter ATP-binding protein, partial [Flavobacteriaceae bacterium]
QKKLKSLKNKLSSVEAKISSLEKEIAENDQDLMLDYEATIKRNNFFDTYHSKKKELDNLMRKWEKISSELETASS